MTFNSNIGANDADNDERVNTIQPGLLKFGALPDNLENRLLSSITPWICFSLFLHIIIFIPILRYAEIFTRIEPEITGIRLDILNSPASTQSGSPPDSAEPREENSTAGPKKVPAQNDPNSEAQAGNAKLEAKENSIKQNENPIKPKSKKAVPETASLKKSGPKSERPELDNGAQNAQPKSTGSAFPGSPAHPRKGNPQPVYPTLARKRGIEGEVLLKITVTATGTVAQIAILKSSGSRLLDDAALNTVKTWLFQPALKNGTAIESNVKIPIRFKLN